MTGATLRAARRRRTLLATLASLVLAVAVAGLVVFARAEYSPLPAVRPYDPLQSW